MALWLQDLIVLVVVAGAVLVLARRVLGTFRPRASNPACDTCALVDAVASADSIRSARDADVLPDGRALSQRHADRA